ncbi:hypothetical protein PCL_01615 [Purpureocillium lilacinum]|uniref:Major facilitator superfamily (MFS) profile domain-containing protein n=1 Tax=Purpureocillium lilacinum TaxID=33203 RepID=A0A2U3E224_PURLI|nr:hypothetical protein PCL_01615 [Purpureocillium lilacinum]
MTAPGRTRVIFDDEMAAHVHVGTGSCPSVPRLRRVVILAASRSYLRVLSLGGGGDGGRESARIPPDGHGARGPVRWDATQRNAPITYIGGFPPVPLGGPGATQSSPRLNSTPRPPCILSPPSSTNEPLVVDRRSSLARWRCEQREQVNMAEQENKPTMDPAPAAVDGAADNDVAIEKEQLQHLDRASTKDGPRPFQAPEIIRSMSPEDRDAFEKKLVRKIDLRLLPMIILMYILNYIDRNNIASARLAGLEDDLKLNESGTQFNTAVSILFVGYLLMQVPSNLLLNKMGKPGKYLPACMAVWGIISTATAACHSFGGLVAARFFLGFVEAAYFPVDNQPGCLYYLSCWYTRKELSVRTTYLYAGSLISGAFSGLIAAGITSNMDGAKGLRAWRWLFIIEGAITIVVAIAAFWILPDFPRTTKWLDEKETALAAWRLEEDIGQDDWVNSEEQTFWHGFKLALEDVKMWVLLVLLFGNISAASITNFFPTVVATLKYSNVITLLLTAPPYCLGVITTFANAWHADRTGERFYHITLPLCLAMVTFIIAAATTNTAARYTAMMLMIPGLYSGFTTALAWISNTLPRPPAKRAAALAFINAVGNATSIYTAYLYPKSAKPGYTGAFIHNCVLCAVAIAAAFVLKLMLVRLNKKLDRGERVEGAINAAPGEAVEHGFRFLV